MRVFSLAIVLLTAPLLGAQEADIVHLPKGFLDAYHGKLAKSLEERPREAVYLQGVSSAVPSPFPEAGHRGHYFSVIHRSGESYAESHDRKNDLYVVLEGSGTLLLGGEMVDKLEVPGRPGEWRSPKVRGGKRYRIAKGDMINIPAKVSHQWLLEQGESITYVIVKIVEK